MDDVTNGHRHQQDAHVSTGMALLQCSGWNKGLAFSHEERRQWKLCGLLPVAVETQVIQLDRVRAQLAMLHDDVQKHLLLRDLRDRNERLFFALCAASPQELLPLIYTPTIGTICQQYSELYRFPRGLFISLDDLGHVNQLLDNLAWECVKTIVVTDGERILGLGDLGANGMGIPTGKCDVITAFGGVRPDWVLPVMLDVGTNNTALLNNALYIGRQSRRDNTPAYDHLVDEFVQAIVQRYGPTTLIQFEDFGGRNAFRFLEKYRHQYSVYNDDIQGTAAVVLAGLLSTVDITKTKLSDHTFLFLGAGMASIGCVELLILALRREGLTEAQAHERIWMMDTKGLLTKDRPRGTLTEEKLRFLRDGPHLTSLLDAVKKLRPTVLIGASAQRGVFDEAVCRAMAANAEHPVIFALSNPTEKAECTAEEAYRWTEGRVMYASGSPFPYVKMSGGAVRIPGQANNCYMFPGIALAAVTYGIRHIVDDMFLAAAEALAKFTRISCAGMHKQGMLYPPISNIQKATVEIAVAVAEVAFAQQLATRPRPKGDLHCYLTEARYRPDYLVGAGASSACQPIDEPGAD